MSHFIHMCTFDTLSAILDEGIIEGIDFVSFTDGMPILLGHGDTAIVFNKKRLSEKSYKFQKVIYDKKFMNQNPDIKKHVFEHKTKKQLQEVLFKRLDLSITELKSLGTSEINQGIERIKEIKKIIRKDVIGYLLKVISYENEMLVESPFKFDADDIDAIIYSSRTFYEYYPLDDKYMPKILFVEDFHPIDYLPGSPLAGRISQIKEQRHKFVDSGTNPDFYLPELYQLVYSLILCPKWNMYTKSRQKPVINLPSCWDEIFKTIHTIEDPALKARGINYVLKSYVLGYNLHIFRPNSEKSIIKQIVEGT